MAISKETKQVRYGNNIITVVRGDMPQGDWENINSGAELSEKGIKQYVDSGMRVAETKPDVSMLSSSEAKKQEKANLPTDAVGFGAKAYKGAKQLVNEALDIPKTILGTIGTGAKAVGDAYVKGATTVGDATGAVLGYGKQVVGRAEDNSQLEAEGQAQANKNLADLGLAPQPQAEAPTAPAPEAQPQAQAQAQPAPVEAQAPVAQAAPKPVLDMKKQDELTKAYEGLKGTSDAARGAIDSMQETRVANLKAEDALRTEAEQLALQRAQTQAEIMNRAQQKRAEMLDRQSQLVDMARKAAEDPIDPNRFWNNKDAGQKAAAVIAGALFGFTGQGMQWLQRLDSLVAQDMQAQSADKTRRIAGLERASEQAGNAALMAMKMGADEAEAQNLERMAKLENVKSRIDMLARGTQNAELAAKGEMMKQQLDEKIMEAAQRNMQLRTAKDAQDANAYLERQKLGLMMGRGGVVGGGKPLDAGQEEDMASLLQAGDTISTAWTTYQKMAGGTGSSIKALGPTGFSDAASWDKDIRAQFSRRVGKTLENRMTDADAASYGAHFLPKSTSSKEEAKNVMRGSVVDAIQKYTNRYNTLAASGRDVSRLPTPQMYEAKIRSQTADILGSNIPASAMEEVQ